jgi:multiple sugar transport system permease protein
MAIARPTMRASSLFIHRQKQALRSAVYHVGVVLFCLVMIYPILWLFASSLKGPSEIFTNIYALIPNKIEWGNYADGWKGFGGISFGTFFVNSLFYSTTATLFAVSVSAIVAYGFARTRFIGQNFWFTCMILTLMLPTQVQIIPQYILFQNLGWINTYLPLIIPRLAGQAFFIFLIMQFIRGIPRELDEAAEMDGCGKISTFFRIILPLIWPALITCAIFSFYWTWEDFQGPLIYLNNPNLYPVSLALRTYSDPGSITNWCAVFAMSALSLVPVFAIFVFFQRFLVQGISTTGLKG